MPPKILIIGAGSSGLSMSLFLAKKGYDITVIDRQSKKDTPLKIGESLPPDAQQLLMELDLWTPFQNTNHLKCYSNKSVWGSSTISYTDFIHHPIGHGWHIDRSVFEDMLQEAASSKGIRILENTSPVDLSFSKGQWKVSLKTKGKALLEKDYDFLVDASGRNNWLARKLGHDRLYEDQQLALVAFFKINQAFEDSSSLIETTADGWWYSAKIPGDRMATAFLCKPNKQQRMQWLQATQWSGLLKKGTHTAQRILESEAELIGHPRFVSADSSILETLAGDGWLAIGDAAMTYDPIASHGILMGMVSARDGANAIEKYFQGQVDALESYSLLLWHAFQYYIKQRQKFYTAEQRFPEAVYWKSQQLETQDI